jgi:hypothetical protein
MVIASPIEGTVNDMTHEITTNKSVIKKFYFPLNFYLFFINNSSIASLQGSKQNGDAKSTTNRTPTKQTFIIVLSP